MTIEELLEYSVDELEKLSDEELKIKLAEAIKLEKDAIIGEKFIGVIKTSHKSSKIKQSGIDKLMEIQKLIAEMD